MQKRPNLSMKLKFYQYILPLSGLLVGILAMTGCGEEDTPRPKPVPSDTEIVPQAVLAETRSALTGAVDGTVFAADTDSVFAVTAMLSKDSSSESDIYFLN